MVLERVQEGYAARRRRLGVPGGNRASFGIIREGHPSTLFSRLDVLGFERVEYELTPDAIDLGLDAAAAADPWARKPDR